MSRRRLIVCADGTWNSEDALVAPTNVAKLHRALRCYPIDSERQWVYYHSGVGVHFRDRVLGGAFGWGITHNLRSCYRFLVDHYLPGDELWFFGFSRGAFTVRSLAGLIRNCGIVNDREQIDAAIRMYRSTSPAKKPNGHLAREFRRRHAKRLADERWQGSDDEHVPEIECIGVWDTVGALGIPMPWWIGWIKWPLRAMGINWWFHDATLGPSVKRAYQALAIHERRSKFVPAVWERKTKEQELEQAWFAGVHCDVGGGYGATGLSDLALAWMLDRANGLELRDGVRAPGLLFAPDCLARCHDSCGGFWRLLGERDRAFSAGDASQAIAEPAARRQKLRERLYWPPSFVEPVKRAAGALE